MHVFIIEVLELCIEYVSANEHGFNYASYNVDFDAGSQFYFSIDGSGTGAEVSLSGQMNTY